MGELVLRHYLMQQAVADKLDREPGVLLDIMRARAQVLANAYLSRTVAAKPVTQEDVDKYIADNPLKFADRQLLSVEQVVFPIGPKAQAAIDGSKALKSLDQVEQELTSMGLAHNRVMGSLSTAEIPEQLFKVIQAKKAEDVFFVRSGPNGVFFKVVGEEPRPLIGDQSANLARQFIRADQFKAEIGAATTAANLEAKYEGDYAGIMKSQSDAAPGGKN
jgi:EpsD family peptidyl-prolyl cis-trans isomerase